MTNSVPGFPCPDCSTPIVVTMEQLVSSAPIECRCGLRLRVDQERSRQVLGELKELQGEIARAQRAMDDALRLR